MRAGQPVVLVVDNVADIVEELLTLMSLNDILAVGAACLDEALDVLRRESAIRVISCDVRLDRESGTDIVHRIAADPELRGREFQYLFMTGDQMQLNKMQSATACNVLSKPVRPDTLMQTLRQLLAVSHAHH